MKYLGPIQVGFQSEGKKGKRGVSKKRVRAVEWGKSDQTHELFKDCRTVDRISGYLPHAGSRCLGIQRRNKGQSCRDAARMK